MRRLRSALGAFAVTVHTYLRTLRLMWGAGPGYTAAALVLTVIGGLVPLGTVLVTQHLVDVIAGISAEPRWWQAVLPWVAGLIALHVGDALTWQLVQPLRLHLRENLEEWLNHQLFERALQTGLEHLQAPDFQDAQARAVGVSGIDLTNILFDMVGGAKVTVTIVSLAAVLWAYAPLLVALPFLAGLALLWSEIRFSADAYAYDYAETRTGRERGGLAELLTQRESAKEIRLYGATGPWLARWEHLTTRLITGRHEIERRRLRARIALDAVRAALYAASLFALLWIVWRRDLTLGGYVAAAAAVLQLEGAVTDTAFTLDYLSQGMRHIRGSLFAFFDRADLEDGAAPSASEAPPSDELRDGRGALPVERAAPPSEGLPDDHRTLSVAPVACPAPPAGVAPGFIALEDVGFTYPGSTEPALRALTLRLQEGERIGLVGPNGAGKSTLARLLLGLYRATEGTVRVDGRPLDATATAEWWQRGSAVFQDFTQYHFTARENILFGEHERPDRLEAAAMAADAAEVAASLPEGYETRLGPTFGGRDLSGGQWQRLGTARAFMREAPDLVVLDEPTAALDPLVEQSVYRRFAELTAGRTAVLISHRLASARLCDRIVVLDGGRIVEEGTHAALLERGGLYARLFRAQAEWYH